MYVLIARPRALGCHFKKQYIHKCCSFKVLGHSSSKLLFFEVSSHREEWDAFSNVKPRGAPSQPGGEGLGPRGRPHNPPSQHNGGRQH